MSITDNHHKEHLKRLAKKVGPVYFLIPHENKPSSIKWNEIFTLEEMYRAASWYSKCLTTPIEVNLIGM